MTRRKVTMNAAQGYSSAQQWGGVVAHTKETTMALKKRFVKDQRPGGRIADSFYRWISRDPRGEKYVTQASATVSMPGRELILKQATCIDEYVVFSNGWRP